MKTKVMFQGISYLSALLFVLFGCFFIFFSEKITFWIITTAPILLFLVNGLSKLLSYVQKEIGYPWLQSSLGLAIVSFTAVVMYFCFPELFKNIFTTVMVFTLFVETAFQMQTALELKKFGVKQWWPVLTLALIAWALALIILLKPLDLIFFLGYMRIIGGMFLLNGGVNLLILRMSVIKAAQ